MNNQDIFNTPEQEALVLAKELGEIKEVLREHSRKVSRIEARAKRAFPSAFQKPKNTAQESKLSTNTNPTMTVDEVLHLYDEVVDQAKGGDIEGARGRLLALELGDLNLMREELGVSLGRKKSSKRVLMEAVLGRVNESLLLTRHINRRQQIDLFDSEAATSDQPEEEKS